MIMNFETIKQILMKRDGMSSNEADGLIEEARDAFLEYVSSGDIMNAMEICGEYFGLEPDYLTPFLGLC